MSDKPKINPAIVAALEHYATRRYDWTAPTMFVYTDPTGHQSPWTIERTFSVALEVLQNEELAGLKLAVLRRELEALGMGDWLKRTLGERP